MNEDQRQFEAREWRVPNRKIVPALILLLGPFVISLPLFLYGVLPLNLQFVSNLEYLALALILVAISTDFLLKSIRARAGRVERAPGARLQRLAELWFSKKIYNRVFEPVLSDLQLEYIEALAEGDRLKARFVLVRGYGAFWMAFVAQLPVSLAKVVVELWIASKG